MLMLIDIDIFIPINIDILIISLICLLLGSKSSICLFCLRLLDERSICLFCLDLLHRCQKLPQNSKNPHRHWVFRVRCRRRGAAARGKRRSFPSRGRGAMAARRYKKAPGAEDCARG